METERKKFDLKIILRNGKHMFYNDKTYDEVVDFLGVLDPDDVSEIHIPFSVYNYSRKT